MAETFIPTPTIPTGQFDELSERLLAGQTEMVKIMLPGGEMKVIYLTKEEVESRRLSGLPTETITDTGADTPGETTPSGGYGGTLTTAEQDRQAEEARRKAMEAERLRREQAEKDKYTQARIQAEKGAQAREEARKLAEQERIAQQEAARIQPTKPTYTPSFVEPSTPSPRVSTQKPSPLTQKEKDEIERLRKLQEDFERNVTRYAGTAPELSQDVIIGEVGTVPRGYEFRGYVLQDGIKKSIFVRKELMNKIKNRDEAMASLKEQYGSYNIQVEAYSKKLEEASKLYNIVLSGETSSVSDYYEEYIKKKTTIDKSVMQPEGEIKYFNVFGEELRPDKEIDIHLGFVGGKKQIIKATPITTPTEPVKIETPLEGYWMGFRSSLAPFESVGEWLTDLGITPTQQIVGGGIIASLPAIPTLAGITFSGAGLIIGTVGLAGVVGLSAIHTFVKLPETTTFQFYSPEAEKAFMKGKGIGEITSIGIEEFTLDVGFDILSFGLADIKMQKQIIKEISLEPISVRTKSLTSQIDEGLPIITGTTRVTTRGGQELDYFGISKVTSVEAVDDFFKVKTKGRISTLPEVETTPFFGTVKTKSGIEIISFGEQIIVPKKRLIPDIGYDLKSIPYDKYGTIIEVPKTRFLEDIEIIQDRIIPTKTGFIIKPEKIKPITSKAFDILGEGKSFQIPETDFTKQDILTNLRTTLSKTDTLTYNWEKLDETFILSAGIGKYKEVEIPTTTLGKGQKIITPPEKIYPLPPSILAEQRELRRLSSLAQRFAIHWDKSLIRPEIDLALKQDSIIGMFEEARKSAEGRTITIPKVDSRQFIKELGTLQLTQESAILKSLETTKLEIPTSFGSNLFSGLAPLTKKDKKKLLFYEEEDYSRIKEGEGTKYLTKPLLDVKTKFLLKPQQALKIKRFTLTKPAIKRDIKSRIDTKLITKQIPLLDTRNILDTKKLIDTRGILDTKSILKIKQIPLLDTRNILDIRPIQDVKPLTLQFIIPITTPIITKTRIIPPIIFPFIKGTPKKKKPIYYNTQIKQKGKFKKINKYAIQNKNKAEILGSQAVDNSSSSRFKITIAKKPKNLIKAKEYENDIKGRFNTKKFRDYRIIKGKQKKMKNEYIEKKTNRIDTKGELQGITAKGWEANRRKKISKKGFNQIFNIY